MTTDVGWSRAVVIKCDKCDGLGFCAGPTPSAPTFMCRYCRGSGSQTATVKVPVTTTTEANAMLRAAIKALADSSPKPVAGQAPRTGPKSEKAKLREAAKRASKRGRKRVHETNGLRQAAYRDRLKARGRGEVS